MDSTQREEGKYMYTGKYGKIVVMSLTEQSFMLRLHVYSIENKLDALKVFSGYRHVYIDNLLKN